MKYALPFLVISSLLCASNSFDMKYSLLKTYWHTVVKDQIANDKIDSYTNYGIYFKYGKYNQKLSATDLAGGMALDNYIIVANFEIKDIVSSCLFSIKRQGNQKLALCFEQAPENSATVTLYSINLPAGGKMTFEHKIPNNVKTKLIISVSSTGVTLFKDCKEIEKKLFDSKNTNQVHLTDDMDLTLASSLDLNHNFKVDMDDLDLYAPFDATTLATLCPNLPLSSQFEGKKGEKGDKGREGNMGIQGFRGTIGIKGESGAPGTGTKGLKGDRGYPGVMGIKGEIGDTGPIGPTGLRGSKGDRGDRGVGEKGERGEPGLPASSCHGNDVSPATTAELDALKSMLSDIKSIFNNYVLEKTEQLKYFTELNTKCNERMTEAEMNIKLLKKTILTDSNF